MTMKTIMSITLNLMFTSTKQPMNMIFIILAQTLMITLSLNEASKSSWFPYLLTIMLIGGMMVLFIYITSITPNEMKPLKIKPLILITLISTIMMMISKYTPTAHMNNTENLKIFISTMPDHYNELKKIYNPPAFKMSIMMMIYLLITLLAMTSISNITLGPLRMKFYTK
nr:NADH dehydrogenase subunit 6 [Tripetaloceroides tonkinensis]